MNNEIITSDELAARYREILDNIKSKALECGRNPDEITLIAVSKTQHGEVIHNAVEAGITIFGENYAQEFRDKNLYLQEKYNLCPEWHFIGHLQSNKVKYIAPYVTMVHSVDSARLATELSEQAGKLGRSIDVLMQVNTSGELSKSGCEPHEAFDVASEILKCEHLRLRGLMTIGSFSEDEDTIRKEFRVLSGLKNELSSRLPGADFTHLSMGMSHDYLIAIEEGATMVRVGTAIFGERNYHK